MWERYHSAIPGYDLWKDEKGNKHLMDKRFSIKVVIEKFRIVPKRDFGANGYWLPNAGSHGAGNYGWVRKGWIVTDGFCNIMPGAAWFRTIPEAIHALTIFIEVNGEPDKFWERVHGE